MHFIYKVYVPLIEIQYSNNENDIHCTFFVYGIVIDTNISCGRMLVLRYPVKNPSLIFISLSLPSIKTNQLVDFILYFEYVNIVYMAVRIRG